jgi:serine acetyltransferase
MVLWKVRRVLRVLIHLTMQLPAKAWLKFVGVRSGPGLFLEGMVYAGEGQNVHLGRHVRLGKGVLLGAFRTGKLTVGDHTYIGRYTIILAYQKFTIGDDCLISPFCHLTDINHGFAPGELIRKQPYVSKPVVIGNDVFIGAGCSILPGVTIGDGAVIGARSVVSRDIPPNAVAVGVPARVIRMRGESKGTGS